MNFIRARTMKKNLIFYHYFEKDISYRDNFLHFFSYGYSKELDYIVIISGPHSIDLPCADNIKYFFTENLNGDFGGYCYAINKITNLSEYEFFFFINSSVRGPFLTVRDKKNWTEYFIDQLEAGVGIVGSTINILPKSSQHAREYSAKYRDKAFYPHVQTTSYLLPKQTLTFLIENGFYSCEGILSKNDVVRDYELRLSQILIDQGWNLKSLLPEYNHLDYRDIAADINPTSVDGDLLLKNSYFGRTLHPYEAIFIKNNRELFTLEYLDRLAYSQSELIQCEEPLISTDLNKYQAKIKLVKTSKDRILFTPLVRVFL